MIWSKSNNYSQSDILRMQQDAINRVHEMQRRSQRTIEETNGNIRHVHGEPERLPSPRAAHAEPHGHTQEALEPAGHSPPPAKLFNPLSNLISALNFDSEQILIVILLVVLINEGADTPIILALLYLLLF